VEDISYKDKKNIRIAEELKSLMLWYPEEPT
jgi:hypothetical protein